MNMTALIMMTLRIGYQQWSSHRLALFMISLAFMMLMLVDSIYVSAQNHIHEATKHVSKNQIWLSYYGSHLPDEKLRKIHQSLGLFGKVCSLYVSYDHLPFEHAQGIAWVYASKPCMSSLSFQVNQIKTSPNYAFSSFTPNQTHQMDLTHEQKTHRILGGLQVYHPALRNMIHASKLIWVPRSDKVLNQATHFIINQTQASIASVRGAMNDAHSWEITTPMKIMIDRYQPNQELLFFFWSLSIIALLSGGANFTHTMLNNIQSRQPEIALRIMLGAKAHHLLLQFILESNLAICMCLIGACALSPIVCWALIYFGHLPLDIIFFPSTAMLLAIFVTSGLLSIYPAYMAKSTNPKILFS